MRQTRKFWTKASRSVYFIFCNPTNGMVKDWAKFVVEGHHGFNIKLTQQQILNGIEAQEFYRGLRSVEGEPPSWPPDEGMIVDHLVQSSVHSATQVPTQPKNTKPKNSIRISPNGESGHRLPGTKRPRAKPPKPQEHVSHAPANTEMEIDATPLSVTPGSQRQAPD